MGYFGKKDKQKDKKQQANVQQPVKPVPAPSQQKPVSVNPGCCDKK